MKYLAVLLIPLLVLSCGNNNQKTLKPLNKRIQGNFEEKIELEQSTVNYTLKKIKDKQSLKKFILPLKIKVNKPIKNFSDGYDKFQYTLIFKFYDNNQNLISSATEKIPFQYVKNKEKLNRLLKSKGEGVFDFTKQVQTEKEKSLNNAKYFSFTILEHSLSERLDEYKSSLSRANEINTFKNRGGTLVVKYNKQKSDSYWSTGNKIKKVMNGLPARIMKEFKGVKKVNLTLPVENKTYVTKISRKDLKNYTGKSLNDIKKNWSDDFTNNYIYGLDNPSVNQYFKEFTKVK